MSVDVTRDAPSVPLPPVDPNVKIPDSVKRQSAQADAFYQQVQPAPESQAAPQSEPQQDAPAPHVEPEPQAAQATHNEPEPQPGQTNVDWERKYHSVRGNLKTAEQRMKEQQDTLAALAEENMRLQGIVQHPASQQQQPPKRLVTDKDVETFGPEYIDLMQRAALEAAAPLIEDVKQQNQQLKAELGKQTMRAFYSALDADLPDWRTINKDPAFLQWLRLPDIYAGRVRKDLLNEAVNAANAPRALAFFQGFLREGAATGQADVARTQPPPQAPRTPAMQLDALAAPGRAKPAPGNTHEAPASKPTYTRAQISKFYADVRRGLYAGRDAEKQRFEADIFSAQSEGRVIG